MMLGRGNFGEVWKCKDPASRKDRAVKILRSDANLDAITHELKMMQLAEEAHHRLFPNVPRIPEGFWSGECDLEGPDGEYKGSALGLAMEYVNGCSLARILEGGPLVARVGHPVIHDVLKALVAMGEHEIIHRDVKPANILINTGGICYLADWGTAYVWELGAPQDIVGTPLYMAPEMVDTIPTRYASQVDIWSLGIVAYEIMVGHTPWRVGGVDLPNEEVWRKLRTLPKLSPMARYTDQFVTEGDVDKYVKEFGYFIKTSLDPDDRPSPIKWYAPEHDGVFTCTLMSQRHALADLIPPL